jgi:tetratricopeptide (TPR) repeat protein
MDLDTLETSKQQESLAQILRDAFVQHRAGDTDEASRAYRQILEKDPQYSDARYLLGLVAAQKGDYVTAIAHLQATVQQVPGNLAYRRSLAEAYFASGNLEQAKSSYEKIRSLAPDDFQSAFQLGRLALMQKQYDAAVLQYRTALGLNPKSAECYSDLGKVMLALKDAAAAEQFFKIALGLEPDLIEAQCNLGNALRKQNRFAEAIEVYQRVLKSDVPSSH